MKNFILALILVSHSYICQTGDTLESIAQKYYNGNKDNRVEYLKFKEGIREINYDTIGENEVWPGLAIMINRVEEQ